MLRKFLTSLLGDPNARAVKKLWPIVEQINTFEKDLQTLPEAELKAKTNEFRQRLQKSTTLDEILPEAYAVVKNACRRLVGQKWEVRGHELTWEMIPYDCQLLGGIILHQGKIAEMKTGEGKTLVCTLPLYLNALTGKGCHLVTVNNYLARRDAEWMGGLFRYLGLTVGIIEHGLSPTERQTAYQADITYGTNTEFGFDYLRDNMVRCKEERVQRGLNFAIVDEVDSILIDEARTPLIISAPAAESTSKYTRYAQLIRNLKRDVDFEIDEKAKTATLTEIGIKRMEEFLNLKNIYTEAGFSEVHHIEASLKAEAVFKRDKDYVVRDNEVIIVDEFTGRLMPGRRFSDGLHQALEAKENVEVRRESRTLATITLQNYFRLFTKLAGMTGTALTEADEFAKIYNLTCIEVPTHQQVARSDQPDRVYKSENGKFCAAIEKIVELHQQGQPVLVGTITIERSELLSQHLLRAGIPHKVLNAKNHAKEAEIIVQAGQKGAVTIATNMAGRGTDIKLGTGVAELGGLFILGTEHHESRRIDNQLRGRSGRQGDPGASQFFVSMEDSLFRLFGGQKMQQMMEFLKVPEDQPIENKMISNSIESAQKKVEAHNFEIRKHLVEYDDVMNTHRKIIYARRHKILEHENIANEIQALLQAEAQAQVSSITACRKPAEFELANLVSNLKKILPEPEFPAPKLPKANDLEKAVAAFLQKNYQGKNRRFENLDFLHSAERQIYLTAIDRLWMEHLENMRSLRDKVSLSGFGQRDPLIEYKNEAYLALEMLLNEIRANTLAALFRLEQQLPPTFDLGDAKTNETEVTDIETGNRELTNDTLQKKVQNLLQPDPKIQAAGQAGLIKIKAETFDSKVIPAQNPTVIRVGQTASNTQKQKISRNAPCHCGSGKKLKKCCGG